MGETPSEQRLAASEEDLLAELFNTARQERSAPVPESLEHRVLMDARLVQRNIARERTAQSWRSRLRGMWDEIGGWSLASGLATATVAGLWLGNASPETLNIILSDIGLTEVTAVESFFPDYDSLLEEI